MNPTCGEDGEDYLIKQLRLSCQRELEGDVKVNAADSGDVLKREGRPPKKGAIKERGCGVLCRSAKGYLVCSEPNHLPMGGVLDPVYSLWFHGLYLGLRPYLTFRLTPSFSLISSELTLVSLYMNMVLQSRGERNFDDMSYVPPAITYYPVNARGGDLNNTRVLNIRIGSGYGLGKLLRRVERNLESQCICVLAVSPQAIRRVMAPDYMLLAMNPVPSAGKSDATRQTPFRTRRKIIKDMTPEVWQIEDQLPAQSGRRTSPAGGISRAVNNNQVSSLPLVWKGNHASFIFHLHIRITGTTKNGAGTFISAL
ncbi:hypothetical protein F5146DRAFT_1124538 [Armillaria mellea]|nr:hypothetical protein F5146DRAFT_1124538 [Armillaria mellea]